MDAFVFFVGSWLKEHWNKQAFQFRLEYFVQKKRDRSLLSHFYGWCQQNPGAPLDEWKVSLDQDPGFRAKKLSVDELDVIVKEALLCLGCEYSEMDKASRAVLTNMNRKFLLILEAAGKLTLESLESATIPSVSESQKTEPSIARTLSELKVELFTLDLQEQHNANLADQQKKTKTDLKVAEQELDKLEDRIKQMLGDIKVLLSSNDISDVERAQNKMSEYKKLVGERTDISATVEGLARSMKDLSQKITAKKDVTSRKRDLARDIQILQQAAVILGVLLAEDAPLHTRARAGKKTSTSSSRKHPQSAHPATVATSVQKNGFQIFPEQRDRINRIRDMAWYGTKFGHAGVMRAASTDPLFKTNADFLQAMIDHTFGAKADQIPGRSAHGLLRGISAVCNRIASFPIWDGEWKNGATVNPDALDVFIQSCEQKASQSKVS